MRFKAKLAPEHVQLLSNLIGPISKLAPSSSSSASASAAPSTRTGGDSDVHGSGSILLGGGGTVVHLDPDHVRISTRGGSSSGRSSANDDGGGGGGGGGAEGISCFAELRTKGGIFLEHRIESAADDVIVFEIDLGQLRLALQSVLSALGRGGFGVGVGKGGGGGGGGGGNANPLHNSMAAGGGSSSRNNVMNTTATNMAASLTPTIVVMKLAKRNGGLPCLCIDANSLPGGRGGGSVEVHHAIPIRVMRAVEMQYHLPPRINMPQVQLELPFDRPLKTVVDRLKTMSPHSEYWLQLCAVGYGWL